MTLRLIHMTDIHFTIEHKAAMEAATAFAHETPHDLLVVSGDVTQRGLPCEFEAFAAWLQTAPKPQIVCPRQPRHHLLQRGHADHPARGAATATGSAPPRASSTTRPALPCAR
jgi:3',5'-cyclic AMP phosphodiesterase CpdA